MNGENSECRGRETYGRPIRRHKLAVHEKVESVDDEGESTAEHDDQDPGSLHGTGKVSVWVVRNSRGSNIR